LQKQIIEKIPDSFIEDFGVSEEFILQLDKNLEFLRLKLANDINKGIRYYLPDLLNNAKRKIDSGSYDDAVARLYRAIELIAQIQLNELSIMDKQKLHDNKVFYINRKQFDLETMDNHKARDYVKKLGIKDYEEREKTFKLALKNSYELLRKFDVQLARDYFADTELDHAKNRRNDSILAHGLTPLSKESACDFYKRVLDYAIKAFPDIEDYMEKAEFPKFNM
jgi:CRISPR-associated protein (TIGR02710 family)